MLQEYNYIAFDFETTGLDTKKDEPIQLWVVQFSADGTILSRYTSLIKPKKSIKELKWIVQFLTWFSLQDLEHAPSIEQVIEETKHFFTENTIVVGHNIWFDVAMLSKYSDFIPTLQVDTYPLSRQLLHYLPSYALDVIHERLTLHKGLLSSSPTNSAHDALHDSYMAYDVFLYLMNHVNTLRRSHMIVDYCMQKSSWLYASLIKRTQKPYNFAEKKLFLQALWSTTTTSKKVHPNEPIDFPALSQTVIWLYESSITDLLSRIDRSSNKWIISVTHKSKQRIIHRLLDELYISHTTFNDHIIFNQDRINAFLHKETFDQDELWFILKYFSQLESGHASMEIQTPQEWKIFSALTERKKTSRSQITICTHDQIRKQKAKIDSTDKVLFLDYDRWYQSYANSLKAPFDPYYMLNSIEQISYELDILWTPSNELSVLSDVYTIFIWLLSWEINQYFTWFAWNRREFEELINDTRFPKTRQAFPWIKALIEQLEWAISAEHYAIINNHFEMLVAYLHGSSIIEKRMYNWDKRWYVFHRKGIFVDYDEFIQSLPEAEYVFCTTNREKHVDLSVPQSQKNTSRPVIALSTTPSVKQLLKKLASFSEKEHHFIFSTSKQHSKELFDKLVSLWVHKEWTITAENITWWVGKNVFHARQSKKPVLCIWGYSFYLELLAKKFAFSHIFLYHIFGSMKQQIVTDLIRYWR